MTAVETYIAMRRGLGYRSVTQERSLRSFARHLDTAGHSGPIPLESTLAWATWSTSSDPCNPARRMATVRGFLRHLSALDGATEVPAPGLLGSTGARKPPHIYTDEEIADLLHVAGGLDPAGGLRPVLCHLVRPFWLAPACASARPSRSHAQTSTSTRP